MLWEKKEKGKEELVVGRGVNVRNVERPKGSEWI